MNANLHCNSIYVFNTGKTVKEMIDDKTTYYSIIYQYFSKVITRDELINYFNAFINEQPDFNRVILMKSIIAHFPGRECDIVKCDNMNIKNIIDYFPDGEFATIIKNNKMGLYIDYLDNLHSHTDTIKHPIEFHIDMENRIILYEGTHRFISAMVKNININYMITLSKSVEFNNIMQKLVSDYINMYQHNNSDFVIYNKIPHYIFDKYKTIRENRSHIILQNIGHLNLKTVIELGPQNGLLSFEFAKEGYNVTAIEYDKEYYDLINNISKFINIKFNLVSGDVHDYPYEENKCDIVVALSIIYHLYRNNKNTATTLLQKIKKNTKYIILDDEPNTNIFTISDINNIFNDCQINKIYNGKDNRSIFIIKTNNAINNNQ